jgi:hypothetical protein
MRNAFSTLVIAISLALLVPNNVAEAVDGLGSFIPVAVSPAALLENPVQMPAPAAPKLGAPTPGLAWILAIGFLGAIVLRRTRDY